MLEHSTQPKQSGEAWRIPHTNNEWDSQMKKYFGEDQHNVHNEGSYCLTDHYLAGKVQLKQLKTCIDVKWPVQTSEGQNTKEKKIDGRFINCKWECLKLIDLVDQKEKINKVSSKKISHPSMERGEGVWYHSVREQDCSFCSCSYYQQIKHFTSHMNNH